MRVDVRGPPGLTGRQTPLEEEIPETETGERTDLDQLIDQAQIPARDDVVGVILRREADLVYDLEKVLL